MILVNMLCSVSPAGFASEHWNALKTNFQHALSKLENTFLRQTQMRRELATCAQPLNESLEGLQGYFSQINCS